MNQSCSCQPIPQPQQHGSKHGSSRQCQILNPLSKARDQTHILMDTSQAMSTEPHRNSSFFFFLGLHLQHTELPRLGVKLELHLQTYTTATATWDPSHICDLCCSLQQCQILNLLSGARDHTHILRDTMLGSQLCEPQWELPLSVHFHLF